MVDTRMPIMTERHSSMLIALMLILDESAAPLIPEISAWLSLVGSPKIEATDAQRITALSAEQSDMSAALPSLPKSAIPYRVFATPGRIIAIRTAPEKLHIPASISALFGESDRVDTQPAIALGASVQPLTIAMPIMSIVKNISIATSVLLF